MTTTKTTTPPKKKKLIDVEGSLLSLAVIMGLYLCVSAIALEYGWAFIPTMQFPTNVQGGVGSLLLGGAYFYHVAIRNGKAHPFQKKLY